MGQKRDLTGSEKSKIVRCLAEGCSRLEIAKLLKCDHQTIKRFMANSQQGRKKCVGQKKRKITAYELRKIKLEAAKVPFATSFAIFQSCNVTGVTKSTSVKKQTVHTYIQLSVPCRLVPALTAGRKVKAEHSHSGESPLCDSPLCCAFTFTLRPAGKHRVTKRGPALSYLMFTLVTGDLGIVGRWRAVCVTALQRPNSDAAAIRIVVGIAAASLSVTGKHRVTKRGPALSNPMFTLVTRGLRDRWSLESCLSDSSPATKQRRCSDPDRYFQDVFDEPKSSSLPPHRDCDCAIDLIPGCYIGGLSTALQNAVDKPLMTDLRILKADALSRSFLPDSPGVLEPVGIPREGVILSAFSPDLRRALREFQADKPDRCPVGKLFVPDRWTSFGGPFVLGWVSSPKFKPRFIGPYKISEIINPVSFRLALPASFAIHNVFHRSLLRRYVVPVVPSVDPPAPVLVEGELEYVVEKILDSRFSRRKLQNLVKWKGYGQEDNSWVVASDVHAADLVRAFHLARPDRPGGSAYQYGSIQLGWKLWAAEFALHTFSQPSVWANWYGVQDDSSLGEPSASLPPAPSYSQLEVPPPYEAVSAASVLRPLHIKRRCSDTDNDPDRCSVAVWSLESCHTDRSPATNDAGNQGKLRRTLLERRYEWRHQHHVRGTALTVALSPARHTDCTRTASVCADELKPPPYSELTPEVCDPDSQLLNMTDNYDVSSLNEAPPPYTPTIVIEEITAPPYHQSVSSSDSQNCGP
ncbi:unnamed protein product [Ranitomeya imitator]|uniref:Chromo domain-containing protein n=1 Tax=Ranitomeya imitator TaxID=111125 RepID=A0ABN9KZE3_9NEOB|nr:unnamed protein product [Ranitomeya imitator]